MGAFCLYLKKIIYIAILMYMLLPMNELVNLGKVVQTGSDGIRRGNNKFPDWEKASDDDLKFDQAIQYGLEFLSDKYNRDYLAEKRKDYLHNSGWSIGKTLKAKIEIPTDVYLSLPDWMREKENAKRLTRWIRYNFPAFDLSWHG